MSEATVTTMSKATPEKHHRTGGDPEMQGWLLKWTNYIKGYQRRWFVLSKGILSYYRNQGEINHTCRGTISLHGALIHTVDSCTFVISNGGTQTFHIKAANEVERQSWVTALELAKAKKIRAIESEEEEEEVTAQVVPSQEINTVVHDLTQRLENLRTCYDLIIKHGTALQRALNELETNDEETLVNRTKIVNERATLFRITSNAMINACDDYLRTAQSQSHKWSKMLQHEREQRLRLEDMVEQLAKQHTQLEQAAHLVQHNKNVQDQSAVNNNNNNTAVSSPTALTSDDEFFDAEENFTLAEDTQIAAGYAVPVEDSPQDGDNVPSFIMKVQQRLENTIQEHQRANDQNATGLNNSEDSRKYNADGAVMTTSISSKTSKSSSGDHVDQAGRHKSSAAGKAGLKVRRVRVPEKPNYPLNLWSIMKNCIGKELSKIPMPVNFNEPLSMLQRLTEDYEYAELLDTAAALQDDCEQLAYVAAFTISSYSTTANRTGKPFNPLLGETYECDRMDDLGWRCIAEQVSHHPPMAAIHCEGHAWTCWQEFTMTSKFRGKYLQVIPLGNAYVHFTATGNKYTWRKVTTTVNNIIVGKLWVDQHGEMEIKGLNSAFGLKCILKYIPYSYFSRETQRRVKGVIMDRNNQVKWVLRGTWDSSIEIAPVLATSGSSENPVYKTSAYKTIWTRRMPPEDCDKYYNFTVLACQLNEMEEGVAPTDSRLRPDQRLMEEGRWDESNREKLRLEENQRDRRRMRESMAEIAVEQGSPLSPYQPIWFAREQEEGTDSVVHVFKGTYWDRKRQQDWSECPQIF